MNNFTFKTSINWGFYVILVDELLGAVEWQNIIKVEETVPAKDDISTGRIHLQVRSGDHMITRM